ncbi:hypothetical protein NEIPOLOT_02263 [Neisseria polysaccharea ATCC 43768]|nr:hypothetical protein NEIPOLOT_02263 [Neisseria polysaccharea ATCC 43768]
MIPTKSVQIAHYTRLPGFKRIFYPAPPNRRRLQTARQLDMPSETAFRCRPSR